MEKLFVCLHALLVLLRQCSEIAAFNLDIIKPMAYSGPPDSYFGYSVDFLKPDNQYVTSIFEGRLVVALA